MSDVKNWTLHLLHNAVRGADNGVKQLSPAATEALYREYAQKANGQNSFIHKTSKGVDVTVNVLHSSRGSTLPKHDS
jgi:hypothetical protein